MSAFPAETIYLLAEISIATVALSGITMVIATSSSRITSEQAAQITIQLRMATIVTAFCIFPLVAQQWGLEDRALWQLSSTIYLVSILSAFVWSLLHPIDMPVIHARLVSLVGLIAILLLGSNIYVGGAWLHLTQLFVGWLGSMFLFLSFIKEVLNDRSEN